MSKKSFIELDSISFTKLLKMETSEIAENMIEILDKHDAEELKIDVMTEILREEITKTEGLGIRTRSHQVTPKLKRQRGRRSLALSKIKLELKTAIKEDPTSEDDDVLLLNAEVTPFLQKVRGSKTEVEMTGFITDFFNRIKN